MRVYMCHTLHWCCWVGELHLLLNCGDAALSQGATGWPRIESLALVLFGDWSWRCRLELSEISYNPSQLCELSCALACHDSDDVAL